MCNELTLVASCGTQCSSLGQVLFADITGCDIATISCELQHHLASHARATTSDHGYSPIKTIFKSATHYIPLIDLAQLLRIAVTKAQ
jgi:hypothetical protein